MTENGQGDNLEIQPDELFKQAKAAALDLLSRREHSALEIQQKLSRRSLFANLDLTTLTELLIAEGWLSHERFAESFIRSRRAKGQGPIRIRNELKQRGLTGEECLTRINDYHDWHELACATLRRKTTHWPEDSRKQAKYLRFLQYRGFDFDAIQFAVEQIKKETL